MIKYVYFQVKLAKSLCKAAISENAYCPLVHNDLFKVVLTPGLVGVELHLLMEEHLRRLAEEVNVDSMQQLSIQFCPGIIYNIIYSTCVLIRWHQWLETPPKQSTHFILVHWAANNVMLLIHRKKGPVYSYTIYNQKYISDSHFSYIVRVIT